MGAADILGNEGLETISRSPFFGVWAFFVTSGNQGHISQFLVMRDKGESWGGNLSVTVLGQHGF